MAYTDYQFYTTKYFGDAVTEEALLIRQVASEYLQGVVDKKGVCLLYAGI